MRTYQEILDELDSIARRELLKGLSECEQDQHLFFMLMYSQGDMEKSIEEVVNDLPSEKLAWAMQQVIRTHEINAEERQEEKICATPDTAYTNAPTAEDVQKPTIPRV